MRIFLLFGVVASAAFGGTEPVPVRVVVWDERQPEQRAAYDGGYLGDAIAAHLARQPGVTARSVSLSDSEQGLSTAVLDAADVLVWWGHVKHQEVVTARTEDVVRRVREGRLGFVALHSAHWCRPFVRLMQERARADAVKSVPEAERDPARWEIRNASPIGTGVKADTPLTPSLTKEGDRWVLVMPQCVFPAWRADGAPGRMTTLLPDHPVAAGLPPRWEVTRTEMYNEPFHVPKPDAVVFEERWDRGEHFRSGCAWQVEKGRVFYFRPGHESYPVFRRDECLRVVVNAVRWAAPERSSPPAGK